MSQNFNDLIQTNDSAVFEAVRYYDSLAQIYPTGKPTSGTESRYVLTTLSGILNGLNAINAIKALKAAALSVIPSVARNIILAPSANPLQFVPFRD